MRHQGLSPIQLGIQCLSFYYFILFFYCLSTVVSILISPLPLAPPFPASHPPPYPSLALSMCPLCMFLDDPPLSSPLIPLPAPPCLLTVCYLFQCVWLYFACSFCWLQQVPSIVEIIWYLYFTVWLISLSIMLSRSTHAVAKSRCSYILSAAQNSIM